MIIVGNIHGNFKTLESLLNKISKEEKDKGIVLAGDLIDRGPRSCEVVQWAIDNNIQVVRGNHEQMMIDWVDGGCSFGNNLWLINGGRSTLNSYRKDKESGFLQNIDMDKVKEHAMWMDKLPFYLEFPEVKNDSERYLVVSHSVAANVWHYRNSNERDIEMFQRIVTWGRPNKVKDISNIYNVIGHTPQENGPRIRKIYANIDTGCFYRDPGYGKLTALQYPEMIIYEQENID